MKLKYKTHSIDGDTEFGVKYPLILKYKYWSKGIKGMEDLIIFVDDGTYNRYERNGTNSSIWEKFIQIRLDK